VKVADGDTITVLDSNKVQHRVRIAGIDAPEAEDSLSSWIKIRGPGQPHPPEIYFSLNPLPSFNVFSRTMVAPGLRPLVRFDRVYPISYFLTIANYCVLAYQVLV